MALLCCCCGGHQAAGGGPEKKSKKEILNDLPNDDDVQSTLKQLTKAMILARVINDNIDTEYDATEWTELKADVDKIVKKALEDRKSKRKPYLTPQEWMSWYNQVLSAVIAIATLGAGFTFSVIFAQPDTTTDPSVKAGQVRRWLIISWLLFVTSLASASVTIIVINANKAVMLRQLARTVAEDGTLWWCEWWLALVVPSMLVQQLLPVAAIMAAVKAISLYDHELGRVGFGVVGTFAVLIFIGWMAQNFYDCVRDCLRKRRQKK